MPPRGVAVNDTYVFVASVNTDSMTVFDVSNAANPSIVGFVKDSLNLDAMRIATSGTHAFVTGHRTNSMAVVDIYIE